MGRSKKYATEEERLTARRANAARRMRELRAREKAKFDALPPKEQERVKRARLVKRWQTVLKNPELYKAISVATSARYRARLYKARGTATKEQIKARWEYYGNKCYCCGADAEATDHVMPLNRGGSNWASNLRPICSTCNSSKGDSLISEKKR